MSTVLIFLSSTGTVACCVGLAVPSKFLIANPSADPNTELLGNTSGRQANRGMEGLAISPDGRTLYRDNAKRPASGQRPQALQGRPIVLV